MTCSFSEIILWHFYQWQMRAMFDNIQNVLIGTRVYSKSITCFKLINWCLGWNSRFYFSKFPNNNINIQKYAQWHLGIQVFELSNSVMGGTSGFIFLKPSTISYKYLLLMGASLAIKTAPPSTESALHSEGQWQGDSHRKQTLGHRVCVEPTGGDGNID